MQDRENHAPLVGAQENKVATLVATIEMRQGDLQTGADGTGDLTETETESNEVLSKWEEERQKSRANKLRSRSLLRRSPPQSMRRFLWPCDRTGGCAQRGGCGWLAKEQASERVVAPTAPRQCCGFFLLDSLMSSLFLSNVSGVDRRETGLLLWEKNDVTLWNPGQCAHFSGNEVAID